MLKKDPSSQKRKKDIPVDPKKIFFPIKPPAEIIVVQRNGKDTIISNASNTQRIMLKNGSLVLTSMGACCNSPKEAVDFVNGALG
jgi:hypothetical protein